MVNEENKSNEEQVKLADRIAYLSIELESIIELTMQLWSQNKVASAVTMLIKAENVKQELSILGTMHDPERYIKIKKEAYGKIGYTYQGDQK